MLLNGMCRVIRTADDGSNAVVGTYPCSWQEISGYEAKKYGGKDADRAAVYIPDITADIICGDCICRGGEDTDDILAVMSVTRHDIGIRHIKVSASRYQHRIMPYINTGTEDEPVWVRFGIGRMSFAEAPNAKIGSVHFLNEVYPYGETLRYMPEYSFEAELPAGGAAVGELYRIAEERMTGTEAVVDLVIADTSCEYADGLYAARREKAIADIGSIDGRNRITVTGRLKRQGDGIKGKFDIKTNRFIPDGAD